MYDGGGEGSFEAQGVFENVRGGGDQKGGEGGVNLLGNLFQLREGGSGNGGVEGKLKEAFGTFDQLVLEGKGVVQFGLGAGIDNTAALHVRGDFGLHFGDFATEIIESAFAFHRIDKHRDEQSMVEVNQGGEPVGGDKAGVAADEVSAVETAADFDVIEFDGNAFGGDDVLDGLGRGQIFSCGLWVVGCGLL